MEICSKIRSLRTSLLTLILVTIFFYNPTDSGALPLSQSNLDSILAGNELVFINFYADWCRFSNMLAPVFDEAADKVVKEFPQAGRVVLGKVDCDKESSVATRFHISKYPTLKVIRNGQPAKREYRGQRSAEAFVEFVRKQMEDPIKEFKDLKELHNLDEKSKRTIIGYFDRKDHPEYDVFRRVATNLKEDCKFLAGFGNWTVINGSAVDSDLAGQQDNTLEASARMHPPNQNIVAFRPDKDRSIDKDETFLGDLKSYDELNIWAAEKCMPLVREITFENAEELTEEGLPFLILFHHPDDTESMKKYMEIVQRELLGEKQNINFLTADGVKFAHPLHHLGKAQKDLPLLAIDSFRHMYLFPDFKDMDIPGKLLSFLKDLHSGKLHREFHYGPDTASEGKGDSTTQPLKKPTTPPESTFKKLAPSKNRYTLLRDEL